MMPGRKRSPYGVQAPLTSLIDIVFMLLIFFLLTTNFITDESIGITLPRARASRPRVEQVITVSVDREGRVVVDEKSLDPPGLFRMLKEKLAASEKKRVMVKADREVPLDKVVRVMDAAKAAGAVHLSLATEKASS